MLWLTYKLEWRHSGTNFIYIFVEFKDSEFIYKGFRCQIIGLDFYTSSNSFVVFSPKNLFLSIEVVKVPIFFQFIHRHLRCIVHNWLLLCSRKIGYFLRNIWTHVLFPFCCLPNVTSRSFRQLPQVILTPCDRRLPYIACHQHIFLLKGRCLHPHVSPWRHAEGSYSTQARKCLLLLDDRPALRQVTSDSVETCSCAVMTAS